MGQTKILLADDSATVRTQICRVLSGAGYDVMEATNGLAALRLAGAEPPSLAILDINMPYLDGFGVCQEIKQMGTPWNAIPIIFLTASRSHALEMLGEQLGAYVQKPISPELLLEVVRDLLVKQDQGKSAVRAASKDGSACRSDELCNGFAGGTAPVVESVSRE
jgi:DNA-binding response OmpR family regulator